MSACDNISSIDVYKSLHEYNRTVREAGSVYHQAAKKYGLSEGCFGYCTASGLITAI